MILKLEYLPVPKIEKRAAALDPRQAEVEFSLLWIGIGNRLFVYDNNFQGLKWGLSNSYK